MGKDILKTLAANLNRLIGPGLYYTSNEATAERSKVGRSTIDRARKAEVSIRIDNLEQLAAAFKLEPWQLLVEGFDPSHPPQLATEETAIPKSQAGRKFHFVTDADIAGLSQEEFEAFDLMMGDYIRGIYARPERKSRSRSGKPEKRSA